MTNTQVRKEDYPKPAQHFDDFEKKMLPAWTRREWWGNSGGDRAYWAALDIQMAFPSVPVGRLDSDLELMLGETCPQAQDLVQGCPNPIIDALSHKKIRQEIGKRLVAALREVKIDSGTIEYNSWGLPTNHWLPNVQRENDPGLPTGLAISGILLNVATHRADQSILKFLKDSSGPCRSALVRFSDDMYVMSKSVEGVLALVEAVNIALGDTNQSSLAFPNYVSNLCLNFNKIRPEALQKVVGRFLKDNGWNRCKVCKEPIAPRQPLNESMGVLDWWGDLPKNKQSKFQETLDRESVGKGDVGPFVTTLVERLSELGTDTLEERFGEGARNYLARLHELARFDIDDEQVRPETRRLFSVNRLVRAWCPRESETQVVRDIRDTVATVLSTTPWQFSLWRAVVRASVRRAGGQVNAASHREATDWLQVQLRRIAFAPDNADSLAWNNVWPEKNEKRRRHKRKSETWKPHYLSFHRAAFWKAVSEVLHDLAQYEARYSNSNVERGDPSPNSWIVRAIPEGAHLEVADWLSDLDEWARILYPRIHEFIPYDWLWEADALAGAMLSSQSRTRLAAAWQSTVKPARSTLQVPITNHVTRLNRCSELLEPQNRLVDLDYQARRRKLGIQALSHLRFGQPDRVLRETLFPQDGTPQISVKNKMSKRKAVMASLSLGCFENIPLEWAKHMVPNRRKLVSVLVKRPFALREYGQARKVVIGHTANTKYATIQRVLWGTPESGPLIEWPLRSWETPAIGLPTAIAIRLFFNAREQKAPEKWTPRDGPLNWSIDDKDGFLAQIRRRQFGRQMGFVDVIAKSSTGSGKRISIARTNYWEILAHEAFYLPFATLCGEIAPKEVIHSESYLLYCDVLLLLTALDGHESILDQFAQFGASEQSFEDRWSWRSRIHLSAEAWRNIERILRWSEHPKIDGTALGNELAMSLRSGVLGEVTDHDQVVERVDIGLLVGEDIEVVRGVSQAIENAPTLPPGLHLPKDLATNLLVRIGQITQWPKNSDVVNSFPRVGMNTATNIMEQVSNVFLTSGGHPGGSGPELVLLPEVTLPQSEVVSLHRLVRRTGIASLAGIYWRSVRPAHRPAGKHRASWMCFVNEAELVVPVGHNDRGPVTLRWFRVRKPVPAHFEDGLAVALSLKNKNINWSILPGTRWYRFLHPRWGDFTIAICADLIDAAPWRFFRGELLHLLMVAHNRDVNLYDALTWVRAYENYVNVASVNHGKFGGSFVWTPQHSHGRELAKLRGGDLFLTADVNLPVEHLRQAQIAGVNDAILSAAADWQVDAGSSSRFKSPPPGFGHRKS